LSTRPTALDLDPYGDASDPTGAGMVQVTLPFTFDFYGMPADSLCVGNDGIAGRDRSLHRVSGLGGSFARARHGPRDGAALG